jgi:hypothetical protein
MSKYTYTAGELNMTRIDIMKMRQASLREDIASRLDSFLIGTVAKSPSMRGYSLTTKAGGKTVTSYVRKDIVPMAFGDESTVPATLDPFAATLQCKPGDP